MAKARVFKFGKRQLVLLPKWLYCEGKEVNYRRCGNGVLLEPVKVDMRAVFAEMDRFKAPFPERGEQPPQQERDPFD